MPKYKATAYIRLSYTDDHSSESDSVSNQRKLIENFVEHNPDIEVVSEKIDDGYSGIIFHRPGFQQMLSDIEAGHVNCVIVKDLPVWDGTPSTLAITSSSISASATSALLRSTKTSTPPTRKMPIPVSSSCCGT